jgi:hypothetical protein
MNVRIGVKGPAPRMIEFFSRAEWMCPAQVRDIYHCNSGLGLVTKFSCACGSSWVNSPSQRRLSVRTEAKPDRWATRPLHSSTTTGGDEVEAAEPRRRKRELRRLARSHRGGAGTSP